MTGEAAAPLSFTELLNESQLLVQLTGNHFTVLIPSGFVTLSCSRKLFVKIERRLSTKQQTVLLLPMWSKKDKTKEREEKTCWNELLPNAGFDRSNRITVELLQNRTSSDIISNFNFLPFQMN